MQESLLFSTDLELEKGEHVVVETRGVELGEISQELMSIEEFNLDTELKSISRKATLKDIEDYEKFNGCSRSFDNMSRYCFSLWSWYAIN